MLTLITAIGMVPITKSACDDSHLPVVQAGNLGIPLGVSAELRRVTLSVRYLGRVEKWNRLSTTSSTEGYTQGIAGRWKR